MTDVEKIAEDPAEDKLSDQEPVQVFDDDGSDRGSNRSSDIIRVNHQSEVTDESEVIRRSTAVEGLEDEVKDQPLRESVTENDQN